MFITTAELVSEGIEQLSEYWDAKGLDMHIAVKEGGTIAVSSKHWTRVHYVESQLKDECAAWDVLAGISETIGRTLVLSTKGPYVYIPKLSAAQTQAVFNHIRQAIHKATGGKTKVTRRWQLSWKIDDAILPDF